METVYFLGIDVSKKKFDAALTVDGKSFFDIQSENNQSAIQNMFRELKAKFQFRYQQLIVCMEHTGVYCLPLLDFLHKNDIKVIVEPALQIKQSQGMTRGKTDQVDAKRIAAYAIKNRDSLSFWKPQREAIQKLKALLATRDRLVKIKVQLQVPLEDSEEFVSKSIRQSMVANCKKTLMAAAADIEKIELSIAEVINQDQAIKEQVKFACSVPGIGKITALQMIITTGEFQKIKEPKKFACYSGIAPFEHSSGSSFRGKTRVSKMGNMTMKKLLHLAAMSAIQCCEELKIFYKRKLEAGKNKMSALNAVRNKLVARVYACIKNGRMYEKIYHHALA